MTTDTTDALERKYMAMTAWLEIGPLLAMIEEVNHDNIHVLRGLAQRADTLANMIYSAVAGADACGTEDMRRSLFGHDAEDKAARGFAEWRQAQEDQAPA